MTIRLPNKSTRRSRPTTEANCHGRTTSPRPDLVCADNSNAGFGPVVRSQIRVWDGTAFREHHRRNHYSATFPDDETGSTATAVTRATIVCFSFPFVKNSLTFAEKSRPHATAVVTRNPTSGFVIFRVAFFHDRSSANRECCLWKHASSAIGRVKPFYVPNEALNDVFILRRPVHPIMVLVRG